MSIAEFVVTYAVCWWIVLFMVLPQQADASPNPAPGHAPSAPEKPRIRKKLRWATAWAFLPAIAMYFIVGAAKASDEIYHVGGGGCEPLAVHTPDDVSTKDGYGLNGKKVTPATLEGGNVLGDKESFDIPLRMPTAKYLDPAGTPAGRNADLSESFVGVGNLNVTKQGDVSLDGKPVAPQGILPGGCVVKPEKPTAPPIDLPPQQPKP